MDKSGGLARQRTGRGREGTDRKIRGGTSRPETLLHPDRLIHERIRLGIVSALAVNESLSFGDLKEMLGTSDGNLSVHARRLEEAHYVTCRKHFEGRLPRTEFRITESGRRALAEYLDHMEALIRATREKMVGGRKG